MVFFRQEAEPPKPDKWPAPLLVVGNQIRTAKGPPVWLQGVNLVSLEWSARGEHLQQSIPVATEQWKSNIVRLPVKGAHWFGKGPGQRDNGASYRALISSLVTMAANRGAYTLLDLHHFGAPKQDDAVFWKEAAATFKNHPAVLFDLFNEPHGISWEIWQSGGTVKDAKKPDDPGFASPGMQGLVDVVRSTGARNIVVAGGLDYAYDLSGIARGITLKDPSGSGIVYATHIYPWKRDWKNKVLAAAIKYPVLVGEVGCDIKKMTFIPASAQEDPFTWAPDMLGFIQQNRLHWTAFSFHPKATPVLISDWEYTPTPFWGAFAKDALGGKTFPLKRMR